MHVWTRRGAVALWVVCVSVWMGSTAGQLNCPPLPAHTPMNISDLRPSDIKVVMTLGDSITAAFGVNGRDAGFEEIRGVSWAIGMDPGAVTVANFLKFFNPNVVGGSLGQHRTELCYGPLCPPFQYEPKLDVLNSAQSGAMVEDLVRHEIDYLIKQVKENKNINLKEDWKLLTILIGANDLCASCTLAFPFLDAKEYEKHLTTVIEKVHKELPRTFVQIVEMFNVSQVYNLSLQTAYCKDVHRVAFVECDCVFRPDGAKDRAEIDSRAQAFNGRARSVANYFQGLKDPQFTVVTQPFGRDTAIATWPTTALSTLDCFHPSLATHQAMAVNLWNNMLTPAAKKLTSLVYDAVPICPTEDTLIYAN